MRYPNHIILDLKKIDKKNPLTSFKGIYWADSYLKLTRVAYRFLFAILSKSSKVKIKSIKRRRGLINLISLNFVRTGFNVLWPILDINFIKCEKLYTKLKYSRSPQYDIVSGGVAALFAGFLGFLISEKFGIELVDSGDFYIFFMYCVFFTFSFRPLIRILSKECDLWNLFSYKFGLNFFSNLLLSFFKSLK